MQPSAAKPSLPPDLFVRCEDTASCPDAVGMLVVDSNPPEEPERCTVTLIGSDRVLTASHCLAPHDRHAEGACPRTWVLFPETADARAEWIACRRVVAATEVVSDDALHPEHAVLQLERASARAPLVVAAQALEPGSIVTVASITPHPIYGTTHALATRLCRVIDSSPAERALGGAAADVGWLASCPIARGNSGSPVLDYHSRVRAIVHGGTALSAGFGVTSALP
ncbi:MAG TPA: trypsin-like peptidase domain-containing protein [Polyangiales bacterium]|nr:trypsin-like peptidase domain-containing protein [Polyangiales bacterium]